MEANTDNYVLQKRIEKLGFKPQKEIIYNKLLPYWDELDDESAILLSDIKENLAKAILNREMRPGVCVWTSRLIRYIKIYGLKFSKEDHVAFIYLVYELCTIPNLDPTKVSKFSTLLTMLLKKKKTLSRLDLVLPWKPLYKLYHNVIIKSSDERQMYRYFSPENKAGGQATGIQALVTKYFGLDFDIFQPIQTEELNLGHTLKSMICLCKHYFEKEATREILDELIPMLCPLDLRTTEEIMDILTLFLPISLPTELNHLGHELWFQDILTLWDQCNYENVWGQDVLQLMANLAVHHVGYIDWEPHIPMVFSRILRSFSLPVTFKQESNIKRHAYDSSNIATWVVSVLGPKSSAQKHLDNFISTIETYLYPANSGGWVYSLRSVVSKLPQLFVQRVSRERYNQLTWENQTPDEHKLTDEDILKFVECLKPIVMQTMFSTMASNDQTSMVQSLALLCPNVIIPPIIERMYASLDSLTEPHKLTSCMISLVSVARPLVDGFKNGYKEGPTHVLPLLYAILPGIDANDFKKSLVTSHFVSIFAMMIPFIDSSQAFQYHKDLTEEEHALCEATAGFQDFVLQYLDRIFLLIESSTFESTRMEQNDTDTVRSRLESASEMTHASTTAILLVQCSNEIYRAALRKLFLFATSKRFEIKVSGQFMASICKTFSMVNGEETLKLFVPHLIQSINDKYSEHDNIETEEIIDMECLYHLQLLGAVLDTNGTYIIPYLNDVLLILDKSLHMSCKDASSSAARILRIILSNLTNIVILDFKSSTNINKPLSEYLSIREWGYRPDDIMDAKLKWHVPNDEEINMAKSIVLRYLPKELEDLDKYSSGAMEMKRHDLLKKLSVISEILTGASLIFPLWDEEPMVLVESILPQKSFVTCTGSKHELNLQNGQNIRKAIIQSLDKLQKKLLLNSEDDIKSLIALSSIWETVLFRKPRMGHLDNLQRNLKIMKRILYDKLTDRKRHTRHMIVERTRMQHEFRLESEQQKYTPTHSLVLHNLLELCTSYYSSVRKNAQTHCLKVLSLIPYSYVDILPKLVEYLSIDSNEQHEKFKGVLYLLISMKQRSLICKFDWQVVSQLWPALLKSKPSEKPSIISLIDTCKDYVHKFFPTIILTIDFPKLLIARAERLIKLTSIRAGGDRALTFQDEQSSLEYCRKFNENNLKIYHELLDNIVTIIQNPNIHWRYVNTGLSFARDLGHNDPGAAYSPRCVRFFLQESICSSLDRRKIAMRLLILVLHQHKRCHKTIELDSDQMIKNIKNKNKIMELNVGTNDVSNNIKNWGIRSDNSWLQYDSSKLPKNEKEWDDMCVLKNPFMGYTKWPKTVQVYAPFADQPNPNRTRDELNDVEREIYDFFIEKNNMDKLLKYLVIEEKKGQDKFNRYRYLFFKSLFRDFGTTFLDQIIDHLENLVTSNEESHQRTGSEILAGLIRGAKHWSFEMTEKLKKAILPLIRNALNSMMVETVMDWGVCFATSAEKSDPRRQYWLIETLMDDPLRNSSSHIDCSRLYVLQGVLHQNLWKSSELLSKLLIYIKPYLNHTFQNVRERISSLLVNVMDCDTLMCSFKDVFIPKMSDVIDFVVPQIKVLQETISINEVAENNKLKNVRKNHKSNLKSEIVKLYEGINEVSLDDNERAAAIRLLKTILKWLTIAFHISQYPARESFYRLLPIACRLENSEQDSELASYCANFIGSLAQSYHPSPMLKEALETIENVTFTGAWWSRCNALDFLQVMVFHNMSSLLSKLEHVNKVLSIVLNLLEDSRLEVREKAGQALCGLLHCNFVVDQEQLLDNFKMKSKTKLRKICENAGSKNASNNTEETVSTGFSSHWEGISVRTRHTAVLGMCAFISAYPYDVPDFLPDVFAQLGVHLNDPEPIPSTIRKTLGDFKRTHHDNWETHKQKFTDEQLTVLEELVIPPTYYV